MINKRFITFVLLFIILLANAQSYIGVYQDLKLATTSDSYGNTPFTTDIIIKVSTKWDSQVFSGFSIEYASLNKSYYRLSQIFGYDIEIGNLHTKPEISFGFINHKYWYIDSFGCGIDTSYKVFKTFFTSVFFEVVNRSDINSVRGSLYFGLIKEF